MQVAIISDTHIPSRETALPTWVRDRVTAADYTIHAGDFDSREALAAISDLAGETFTAVRGNIDSEDLGLPAVEVVDLDGVQFVVTHGSGSLDGYEERVVDTVRTEGGPDAVGVSGHTHEPMDEVVDGVRLLNPGSATGADPAAEATMMTVLVDDGDLDVTLHRE